MLAIVSVNLFYFYYTLFYVTFTPLFDTGYYRQLSLPG